MIYAAIDEIEAALKGMLKPIYEEVTLGQAEIREIFRSSRAGIIAGCMVIDGTIRRNAKARLLREGAAVADSTIGSLRREKDDVTEVREGFECGMTLANYSDIRIGDIIETYEMRRRLGLSAVMARARRLGEGGGFEPARTKGRKHGISTGTEAGRSDQGDHRRNA